MPSVEELQLLNKILVDGSTAILENSGLNEEHFPIHKEAYLFINNFAKSNGQPPTAETVLNKFDSFELIEPEAPNAVINSLKEDWLHRQFKPILIETSKKVGEKQTAEALQFIKAESAKLLGYVSSDGKGYSYVSNAEKRKENYLRIHGRDRNDILGITTGFKPLDLAVNGLEFGANEGEVDFFLVFAPTNMGKTLFSSFMLQAAWAANFQEPESNLYPAYFALEQRAVEIAHNWDNILAKISRVALTRGTMTNEQKDKYCEFIDSLKRQQKDMMIYDIKANGGRPYSISEIRRILESEGHTHFVLDQLSKVRLSSLSFNNYHGSELRQRLFNISAEVREMILEIGVPGYIVAQANRESAKRVKKDSSETVESEDIGEAYAIVQDASKGISIAKVNDNTFRITVIKTRNNGSGQTFLVKYNFDTGLVAVLNDSIGEQFI